MRSNHHGLLPLGCLLLLPLIAGCYEYVPVRSSPAVGTSVAVTLRDSGSVALAGYLGPRVRDVRGELESAVRDDVTVAVNSVRTDRGEEPWAGEPVTLPLSLIAGFQARHFAPLQTALAAVAAVAAAFIGGEVFHGAGSGTGPAGTPPANK